MWTNSCERGDGVSWVWGTRNVAVWRFSDVFNFSFPVCSRRRFSSTITVVLSPPRFSRRYNLLPEQRIPYIALTVLRLSWWKKRARRLPVPVAQTQCTYFQARVLSMLRRSRCGICTVAYYNALNTRHRADILFQPDLWSSIPPIISQALAQSDSVWINEASRWVLRVSEPLFVCAISHENHLLHCLCVLALSSQCVVFVNKIVGVIFHCCFWRFWKRSIKLLVCHKNIHRYQKSECRCRILFFAAELYRNYG